MGFFSWQTADKQESIGNSFSAKPHTDKGPIYLLQPGKPPIIEEEYEGYGRFGGVDAYVWLAVHNMDIGEILNRVVAFDDSAVSDNIVQALQDHIATPDGYDRLVVDYGLDSLYLDHVVEAFRNEAISEFVGKAIIEVATQDRIYLGRNGVPARWDEPCEWFGGQSLTDALNAGLIIKTDVLPSVPLKFSFNKDADYQSLGPSQDCPYQGYFFDEPDNTKQSAPPAPKP